MKTIGLLGGMSWESSLSYYRMINQQVSHELGGMHSARISLLSVDFETIEVLQRKGEWEKAGYLLSQDAKNIESSGADFLLICTNTMHKVYSQIEKAVSIPLIHIADSTGEALKARDCLKVGLLGTAFTMEQSFYKDRLTQNYGVEVIIPDANERELVHRVIYDELCLGNIRPESKQAYLRIIKNLVANGAQAIILGCTEIGLLISQSDTQVPLFDTAEIHAKAAVERALAEN